MYLHVLAVLEDILGIALQSVNVDVAAEHERISTFVNCKVTNLQSVNAPESLVGIVDYHILNGKVLHLAEQFRSIDNGVAHNHIVRVPYSRARAHLEVAVCYQ